MSGSIGGDRIPHSAVKNTLDKYKTILQGYKAFKSLKPSGSTVDEKKVDHGDLDVVTYLEGTDIKEVKKDFMKFLDSLPDDITVPFRSGRNKGKKSMMYADIVTCQIPMEGFEGLLVQIDNAIVLSEQEQTYKKNFLDLPGEKQALLMGLVRTGLIEESPDDVFKRLNIKNLPELEKGQELEFVLSPNGLTLRRVTLDSSYQEISHEDIWKSYRWSDVEALLRGYSLDKDFDELLSDIKSRGLSARSRVRITGLFNSVLVVGPGEQGKPKGDNKERARGKISSVLGEVESVEETKTVALYGGGFKPPHKAHFANAEKLSKKADRLIVFIGPKIREGVPITAEQSEKIWNIYKKYLNIPVEIRISEVSPITSIYNTIRDTELLNDTHFIVAKSKGTEEDKKYAYILKHPDKFERVTVETLPVITDAADNKFSASTLRQSIDIIKKGDWIPSCLDREDARKVLEILINPLEECVLEEEFRMRVQSVLDNIQENSSGTPVRVNSIISSEKRSELASLYGTLVSSYGNSFNIQFNQSSVVITPRYEEKYLDYDYIGNIDGEPSLVEEEGNTIEDSTVDSKWWTDNIASMIEFFQKEGLEMEPLPEIILKKEPQSNGLLDKTGDYDPKNNVIHLYTADRHPVDILRSCAHELFHTHQNHLGKIDSVSTEQITKDSNLNDLEGECFKEGNLLFRKWLETKGKYKD